MNVLRSSLRLATPARRAFAQNASFPRLGLVQQQRLLSDDLKSKLQSMVQENKLVVFMNGTPDAPECWFSEFVIECLEMKGVDLPKMKAVNVLEDDEIRAGIKEFSNWPVIPQVYVNGEMIGGFNAMLKLDKSGELETMLIKEGLAPPGKWDVGSGKWKVRSTSEN